MKIPFSIHSISISRMAAYLLNAVGDKNYILFLSILVGLISGLAAVAMKSFAEYCHHLGGLLGANPWIVPALPVIGVFACILFVKFWIRGPYDKSLAGVISATSNGTSDVPVQKTYSHIFTSGITVGMGGSAGLEAPIVLTGSAIGSNVAKFLLLGRESRTLLLACGGAAGVSAVFDSPVAGALFACEILLPEFSIPALIPLLMSSATAAVVAQLLYSNHSFSIAVIEWNMGNIPYYILLGLLAGLVSAFVIRSSIHVSKRFGLIHNVWVKGLLGCAILYLAFLIFPMLKGEGYYYVNELARGHSMSIIGDSPLAFLFEHKWVFVILMGALVLIKAPISFTSVDCGGDGGAFAPSMFMGAFLGFTMARAFNLIAELFGSTNELSLANFIAVGMGGVLAGVMHAPMTGIFLIAEITGGYKLFIPLMIVASLACYVSKRLAGYNIYKSAIQMRGEVPEPNQATVAVSGVALTDLIEQDFKPVHQDDSLRTLLQAIMASKRNIFPVLDDNRKLVGLVTLDHVRPYLLDDHLYDMVLVFDIMTAPGPVLLETDRLTDATQIFEKLRAWNLPVVDNDGAYVGFVSKSGVFDRYRNILKNKQELF